MLSGVKFAGNLTIFDLFVSSIGSYCKNGARKTFGLNSVCIIFAWKTACQKYSFQILSQKNAEVVNLKNPDLDLIRSILLECGYFGFVTHFRIFPKKTHPKISTF